VGSRDGVLRATGRIRGGVGGGMGGEGVRRVQSAERAWEVGGGGPHLTHMGIGHFPCITPLFSK